MRILSNKKTNFPDFFSFRLRMVEEQVKGRGINDPRVISAMAEVPRHLFVPASLQSQAYRDIALPIGEGQTISQPYMVALMSAALELKGKERVLEIGTGSGYQTAILSKLAERVYSVERIRSLLERARKILDQLHCHNVLTRLFDGSLGWKEEAPFDAILVTAATDSPPPPLLQQLKEGGIMVVPIGSAQTQKLIRIRRRIKSFIQEELGECQFVAMIGRHGLTKF
jgi:protein-L-isoaspartate(D-aspartate) O-methyltransferase